MFFQTNICVVIWCGQGRGSSKQWVHADTVPLRWPSYNYNLNKCPLSPYNLTNAGIPLQEYKAENAVVFVGGLSLGILSGDLPTTICSFPLPTIPGTTSRLSKALSTGRRQAFWEKWYQSMFPLGDQCRESGVPLKSCYWEESNGLGRLET